MTMIETLDLIDTLVSKKSDPAEIRGQLLAIREQIEAYDQKAEELSNLEITIKELKAANEKLIAENAQLKALATPKWGSQPRIRGRMEQ